MTKSIRAYENLLPFILSPIWGKGQSFPANYNSQSYCDSICTINIDEEKWKGGHLEPVTAAPAGILGVFRGSAVFCWQHRLLGSIRGFDELKFIQLAGLISSGKSALWNPQVAPQFWFFKGQFCKSNTLWTLSPMGAHTLTHQHISDNNRVQATSAWSSIGNFQPNHCSETQSVWHSFCRERSYTWPTKLRLGEGKGTKLVI